MAKGQTNCSFCRKSYRDVGPLVEGPDAVHICGECAELCQTIVEQERYRRAATGSLSGPTREVIRERLDQLVAGQDQVKNALVQAALDRHDSSFCSVVLIGPARSSKALLARALAHAIEAPFAEGDAQELVTSDTGLIYNLLTASAFDVETAQRGVVYVDGIDQRATQERLLQMWDGIEIANAGHCLRIDLARVLFICGADFTLSDPSKERALTPGMLASFGVAPALISRIRAIARVASLDDQALARILPFVDLGRMIRARLPDSEAGTEKRNP